MVSDCFYLHHNLQHNHYAFLVIVIIEINRRVCDRQRDFIMKVVCV